MNLTEILNDIIGPAPAGLEWLTYLLGIILIIFGLICIVGILNNFFSFFNRK